MYPLVIVRGGSNSGNYDEYGDPIVTEGKRIHVDALKVAPRASEESAKSGRYGIIVGLSAYLPTGTDIESTDTVEYRGPYGDQPMKLYAVEGEIGVWEDEGLDVSLKRAEG